jgi:hypothetical protein
VVTPSNPNNPYIQPQGGGRAREGPLRKPKVHATSKQQFNISDQVEELEELTEIKV